MVSYSLIGGVLHPGSPERPTLESSNINQKGNAMSILWAILIGFVVGIVAKFLMPGRDGGGFILTTVLGIVGAVVATFLGQAMGLYTEGQSAGFIGAVVGAMVVLLIFGLLRGKRGAL
jgi:uncharacterized membrane protein YeaQ/YmgE (transglycosylase-associated protein family)